VSRGGRRRATARSHGPKRSRVPGRRSALGAEPFTATRDLLRAELAADLSRGGYVLRDGNGGTAHRRYFDKFLVLCRPGLLTRAARLLTDLLSDDCERLAATSLPCATLATALAQEVGLPLLLGADTHVALFGGELSAGTRVTLVEDVAYTGRTALAGVQALRSAGAEPIDVVCLLDRQSGAAQLLAAEGVPLRALFTETELLEQPGQPPR
jgi:orotate phosphoribosyltransferase